MSQYGQIYRLQFDTSPVDRTDNGIAITAKTITVNIYNTANLIDDADDPEVIELTPAGEPLFIETINNEQDKFATILAKQATIQFLSDQLQAKDVTAFADAADNQWYVEIDKDGDIIFKGFLMLSDMQQPFLPDPQVIQLTASDHLGALRDLTWVDDDGINPIGKYTIAQCLALALKQTGMNLEIIAISNLRHGSGQLVNDAVFSASGNYFVTAGLLTTFFYPGQSITVSGTASNNGSFVVSEVDNVGAITQVRLTTTITVGEGATGVTFTDNSSSGHWLSTMKLDAKTFEKMINESNSCYDVLTKILSEDSVLFQHNGKWWIVRRDEYDSHSLYPARFDADGAFIEYLDPITTTFPIGIVNDICHADASTILRIERQHKRIRETFRYINPLELICNINFERGDYIEDGPNIIIDGIEYTSKHYEVDCWTVKRIFSQPITSTIYIRRLFYNGVEKQRYMVVTPSTTNNTPFDYAESQPMRIETGDKADVSVSYASENNFGSGGGTIFIMKIYILGDDGNYYYWWHPTSSDLEDYYWTNAGTTQQERLIGVVWDAGSTDESKWRTLSVSLASMPVGGNLYIGLIEQYQGVTSPQDDIYYQSLRVDLIPLINGSYQSVTGHYNQVTRNPDTGYNALRDNEVNIGDSPRQTFKGAMFFTSGGIDRLSQWFYSAHQFDLGYPPDTTYLKPFGYIQAFSVWNQYRYAVRIFDSSLYGLVDGSEVWADLWQKYELTDANGNTINRYFVLISMRQNWRTCRWTGLLVEVYRTDLGKDETDDHDFEYITD